MFEIGWPGGGNDSLPVVEAKQSVDFFYGSMPCTIAEVVRVAPELFAGCTALVTCLDKNERVRETFEKNVYGLDLAYRDYGKAALLEASSVTAFLTSRYITRFDEIWFFSAALPFGGALALRPSPRFTSDVQDFIRPPSDEFLKYFGAIGASFAFGDGFDLNYIARERALAGTISALRF